MGKLQVDAAAARQLLDRAEGYVRKAIALGRNTMD